MMSRSLRFKVSLLTFMFLFSLFVAGSHLQIDEETARMVVAEVERIRRAVVIEGTALGMAMEIFMHNARALALASIPLGIVAISIIMFATGISISAVSISHNIPRVLILMGLLSMPHTWMEFISYTVASAQSTLLLVAIIRGRIGKELGIYMMSIALSAAMLFAAAVFEAIYIEMFMAIGRF